MSVCPTVRVRRNALHTAVWAIGVWAVGVWAVGVWAVGVWAVGAEVMLSVGIGFEHAVVIVPLLMAIVGVYGGTIVTSSVAQLLLVGPVHDSADGVVSVSAIDSRFI